MSISARSRPLSSTKPTGCSTWDSCPTFATIIAKLPSRRQTLLFSATMPEAIERSRRHDSPRSGPRSDRPGRRRRRNSSSIRCSSCLASKKRDYWRISQDAGGHAGAGFYPHQARRRPRRPAVESVGDSRRCDPRKQEPGGAAADPGRFQVEQDACPGGHGCRLPRDRRGRHLARHELRSPA